MKSLVVNFNQKKTGLEIRFNFRLDDLQRSYLKTLGFIWFGKRKYYWTTLTSENYEAIAKFLDALEKKGYEIELKSLLGSMRAPKK